MNKRKSLPVRPAVVGAFLLALLLGCATTDPLHVLEDRTQTPAAARVPAPRAVAAPAPAPLEELGGEPLSLARCVDLGLTRNPSTRSAWLAARSAAADVGVARSAWLPEASLSASAGLSGDPKGAMGDPVGASGSVRLSVGYLLFDGGARKGRIDAARARLDAADFRHQERILDVALDVEESYYALQSARWYAGVVDELIKQSEYQAELAAARFEVGLARRYDVVQAKARLAEARLLRTTATSQVRKAAGGLARAMGLDARTAVSVEPLPEEALEARVAGVEELMATAVEVRPELGAARSRVEEALAATRIARAGHLPAVSADAGVLAATGTQSGASVPWTATVGLSVPLFTGFETTYSVRKARYDEEQARADLAEEVNDIQFEVWSAHTQVTEARETVVAAGEVVVAAREAVALAEENYKTGTGDIGDLFTAQAGLVSARLQEVTARIDWLLGLARLHRAVGQSLAGPAVPAVAGGRP